MNDFRESQMEMAWGKGGGGGRVKMKVGGKNTAMWTRKGDRPFYYTL